MSERSSFAANEVPSPRKPEYNIVTAFSEADLESLVTKRMADGWLPQGGLQVTFDRYYDCDSMPQATWHFHQAMLKTIP